MVEIKAKRTSARSRFFLNSPKSFSSISVSSIFSWARLRLLFDGVSCFSIFPFFLAGVLGVFRTFSAGLLLFCFEGVFGSGVSVPPLFGLTLLFVCSLAALFLVLILCGLASGLSANRPRSVGKNTSSSFSGCFFLPSLAPSLLVSLSFVSFTGLVVAKGGSSFVFFKWALQSQQSSCRSFPAVCQSLEPTIQNETTKQRKLNLLTSSKTVLTSVLSVSTIAVVFWIVVFRHRAGFPRFFARLRRRPTIFSFDRRSTPTFTSEQNNR